MQARTKLDTIHEYLEKIQNLRGHATNLQSIFGFHLKTLERKINITKDEQSSLATIHLPFALVPSHHLDLIQETLQLLNPQGLSLNLNNFQRSAGGRHSFTTFIPALSIKELIISTNTCIRNIIYSELKGLYTALFSTVNTCKITSLHFKSCNLGMLKQGQNEHGEYSLETFLNEIGKAPIISLSISNDSLDKWSNENWFSFLKAINESKTIMFVKLSNVGIAHNRVDELRSIIQGKAEKNTLKGIVARSIANNICLFKKEEIEKLPEPCVESIQYYLP